MEVFHVDAQEQVRYQAMCHDADHKRQRTAIRRECRLDDIARIRKHFPSARTVLCVGARDDSEVLDFIRSGYEATGIDVANETGHIRRMDAHDLSSYRDREFDLVYASHVFEHAHDAVKVMGNIHRVASQGAFVILPMTPVPRIQHPSIFEIMKSDENPLYFDAPREFPEIWRDFQEFLPYEVLGGGYRLDRSAPAEPEREAFILFRFLGAEKGMDKGIRFDVCVITMNSPRLRECVSSLEKTGYSGRVHFIENVSPMAMAFDHMKRYSEGEWTLQLDEDMFLHPDAVEKIESSISRAETEYPGKIGLITFRLNDHFFGETIGHLKLWRTEVLRRLEFRDMKGGDRDFVERMELYLGLSPLYTDYVIAEHIEKPTPRSIYSKMRDMVQKQTRFGWESGLIFDFLARRFSGEASELNFMALVGAIDGLIVRDGTELRSKASEEELKRPSYLLARDYWYEREKAVRRIALQRDNRKNG